ncbi:hypothetical protein LTR84_004841 [Exophiala bonariae]|uniref:Uncharacterized protein n=1 Tax=Exophiala bonariae TaxID=1690606 RepID=A0AAV9NN08_9EURO|nr:hypothetical protein LTR84_004841 [Exophiala bonariae]
MREPENAQLSRRQGPPVEDDESSVGMKILSSQERDLLVVASNLREEHDATRLNRRLYSRYHTQYISILHERYHSLPDSFKEHFRATTETLPENGIPSKYFGAMAIIAEQLSDERVGQPCTLRSITDLLRVKGFLNVREVDGQGRGSGDEVAGQLVYILMGWVTLMFAPTLPTVVQEGPSRVQLAIEDDQDENGVYLDSDTLIRHSVPFDEVSRLTLPTMLKTFGRLIPCSEAPTDERQVFQVAGNAFAGRILVSYINYRCLRKLSDINIVFTSAWSRHLEFDEFSRTIKIFKHPSACMVFCSGSVNRTAQKRGLAATLFSHYFRSHDDDEGDYSSLHDESIDGVSFFRELLLTYRVIFGQDGASAKLFRTEHEDLLSAFLTPHRIWHYLPWLRPLVLGRKPIRRQLSHSEVVDPLLLEVCGTQYTKAAIYRDLRAPSPRDQYLAAKEFPFFGDRLLKIQIFMQGEHPSDWKALINDRRDILRYWTFWAVMVIGAISILQSAIANILGILQVIY